MKKLVALLALFFEVGSLHGQPLVSEQPEVRAEMQRALAPLRTLSEQQMTAVAALALAYRAGISVEDHCPPLKTFSGPQRTPCEGPMVAYASAVRDCKKAHPERDCPSVLEAEANWSACEFNTLGKRLMALKVVQQWPKPKPQPDPTPYTR